MYKGRVSCLSTCAKRLYIHICIYVQTCTQKPTWHMCYDAYGLTSGCRRVAVLVHVNQHLTENVVDEGLRYAGYVVS